MGFLLSAPSAWNVGDCVTDGIGRVRIDDVFYDSSREKKSLNAKRLLVSFLGDITKDACASVLKDVELFLMAAAHGAHEFVRLHSFFMSSGSAAWMNNWGRMPEIGDIFIVATRMPIVTLYDYHHHASPVDADADVFARLSRSSLACAKEGTVGLVVSDVRSVLSGPITFTGECPAHDFCNRTTAYVIVSIEDTFGAIDIQTLVSKTKLLTEDNERKK